MAYGLSIEGLDHVPLEGAVIVAPNHTRWADHFVVAARLPLHFGMGKVGYFTPASPSASWIRRVGARIKIGFMRGHGMYPVKRYSDRSPEALSYTYEDYFLPRYQETILAHIQQILPKDKISCLRDLDGPTFTRYLLMMGEFLMWFPQGTRHPQGDSSGAKPGLGKVVLGLAEEYGLKTSIVPTALLYQHVGRLRPWPPMMGLKASLRYDGVMSYDDLLDEYLSLDPECDAVKRRRIEQAFCDRIMERVGRMLDEMV